MSELTDQIDRLRSAHLELVTALAFIAGFTGSADRVLSAAEVKLVADRANSGLAGARAILEQTEVAS